MYEELIDQSKLIVGKIYSIKATDCCLGVAFTAMFMGYDEDDFDEDGKPQEYMPLTKWDVEGLQMRASGIEDWDEGDSWW